MVITGASSGIGRATAERFAEKDADLALIARSERRLQELASDLKAAGAEAHPIVADLAEEGKPRWAIEHAADKLGGIDVLVANAAASAFGPFEEIPPKDFRRTVEVSLFGAIETTRAGLPYLQKSKGTLIVTGSIVRDISMPMFTPYITAKAGLRGFVDALRSELHQAGSPVEVCIVEPGPVDTPFWKMVDSTTGEVPPVPVGAVDASQVADKIVERSASPTARSVVGPYALAQRSLARALPRLTDRLLPLAERYFEKGSEPARGPGALWQPAERAAARKSRDIE